MECKVQIHLQSVEHGSVLIETLWNEKNHILSFFPPVRPCINRNIVECKVSSFSIASNAAPVLIETLWNVKHFFLSLSESLLPY